MLVQESPGCEWCSEPPALLFLSPTASLKGGKKFLLPGWGIAVVRVFFRMPLCYPSILSLRMVHILPHSSPLQTPTHCSHRSNFPCFGQITAPSPETAHGSSTGESCLFPGKEEQRSPRPARGTRSEGGDTSAFISVNGLWLLQQRMFTSQLGSGLGFVLAFVFSFLIVPSSQAVSALGAQRVEQVGVKLQILW